MHTWRQRHDQSAAGNLPFAAVESYSTGRLPAFDRVLPLSCCRVDTLRKRASEALGSADGRS